MLCLAYVSVFMALEYRGVKITIRGRTGFGIFLGIFSDFEINRKEFCRKHCDFIRKSVRNFLEYFTILLF